MVKLWQYFSYLKQEQLNLWLLNSYAKSEAISLGSYCSGHRQCFGLMVLEKEYRGVQAAVFQR